MELNMNRSLRKGTTSIFFQHLNTGNDIRVKLVESELKDNLAILRFTLAPASDDQKHDESYLHDTQLELVSINDNKIIDGFREHMKYSSIKITKYKLELLSRSKKLEFFVSPKLAKQGDQRTLHLTIIDH